MNKITHITEYRNSSNLHLLVCMDHIGGRTCYSHFVKNRNSEIELFPYLTFIDQKMDNKYYHRNLGELIPVSRFMSTNQIKNIQAIFESDLYLAESMISELYEKSQGEAE